MLSPKLRVLYVDNDRDSCAMLIELLCLSGIRCQSADSAAEAWRMIPAQRFDLYMLQAWLPDVDGFRLCSQLRASYSKIPILFYSAAAYPSDRQKGLGAGADAYLVKPYVENLASTISGLITEAREVEWKSRPGALRNLIESNRRATT
ncbi:MAG TPA: response regulator, partial [Pyrinomonadaceae bacterium]|nr:response regulator [Pyrinomonadaceae bacterium]